jgi:prophage regulatory protein
MVLTILRRAEVERATGLPRSTIYEMMATGRFPKPVRLGARSVGWIESEVLAWQRSRITARDDAEAAA